MNFPKLFCQFALFTGLLAVDVRGDFQGATHLVPFDEEALNYSKTESSGKVAQLKEKVASWERDPKHGYLPALLKELKVPVSSQVLVFSKTSLQRERISPSTPRALYYNDDVYVGYIPGSPILEVTEVDPKLGAVFYTLENRDGNGAKLQRNDQCLECHASAKSMGVPGHLVRSFVTDKDGVVDLITGVSQVNHRTPFEERWGGWYVTGTHGKQFHRGNLFGKEEFERQKTNFRGNLTELNEFFRVADYPEKGSDLVSLLVLEHQTHMHNFITRYNFEAVMALKQYGHVRYMNSITDAFVKYLLFTEEAPLTEPVKGSSKFAEEFARNGIRDSKGRSLRDFDLQTRIFKYPCSYLIYSEAFEGLPREAKERIYAKLWDVVSGKNETEAFAKLNSETRQAIREILIDTKKDLPDYWKKPAEAASLK